MKVLLVIDMQNGFIENEKYKSLINKINSLILNKDYDKIIFTKFINDKKFNPFYEEKIGWKDLKTKEEQKIITNVPKNSIIFEKYGYGIKQSDLEYIKSLNIKEIDICGVKTEACVYTISLQLWDSGIYPNILINYVLGDVDMKNIYIKQFGGVNNKE